MRPLEILASLLSSAGLVILLLPPLPASEKIRFGQLFLAAAILFALLQIALEGAHWQLLPLYLAILLFAMVVLSKLQPNSILTLSAAIAAITLILATATLSWLMPMFQLPKPTGQFAVGTKIISLVDGSRPETQGQTPSGKRELVVQAWYPLAGNYNRWAVRENYQRLSEVTRIASYRSVLKTNSYRNGPIASGPLPVLLYNPGWMGERTEGTYQMEELASHGFFVVSIDHTFFGGRVELSDGRVVDSRGAPELADFEHATAEQVAAQGASFVRLEADDDVFILDQLEAINRDSKSPWCGKFDLSRVGAMGFSLGGAVATQVALDDKRILAALNLDGWSFGDVQQQGLAKPWMVIYQDKLETLPTPAQLNSDSPAKRAYWKFSYDDYASVTRSMQQHGGYVLFLADTEHVNFTDRALFSPIRSWTGRGLMDPNCAHAIINRYTLAFFLKALYGGPQPLLDGAAGGSQSAADPAVEFLKFPGK